MVLNQKVVVVSYVRGGETEAPCVSRFQPEHTEDKGPQGQGLVLVGGSGDKFP